ncbi:metallophosphoesterase family protein [Albibacterium indicum]|uniref:metallophosphoesterase family protein n=1 Tax=Albibacterium indicum TaxID=2292082 RepID=UPI000E532A4D|nr:metallophosphoesterase [Pedobacter indicus]
MTNSRTFILSIALFLVSTSSSSLLAQTHYPSTKEIRKEQKDRNLKILLISDLNDSYGSVTYSEEVHDVIGKIEEINPDIILCGGDMVAGQKASLSRSEINAMWNGFDSSVLTPIYKLDKPFGFTVGNHDASPNYHKDRAAASDFWVANKDKVNLTFVDDKHFPYFFSYIKNNIFFISWDASSAQISAEVKIWMEQQLSSKIARKAKGRIVLGHLPLYAIVASKNKPGEVLDNADETLEFLKDHKVDMYISGHQHAYFPATKQKVTLLHSGCLGGGPRQLLGDDHPAQKTYAIIEISKTDDVSNARITGIQAEDHTEISLDALPDSIRGFNGVVKRIIEY